MVSLRVLNRDIATPTLGQVFLVRMLRGGPPMEAFQKKFPNIPPEEVVSVHERPRKHGSESFVCRSSLQPMLAAASEFVVLYAF